MLRTLTQPCDEPLCPLAGEVARVVDGLAAAEEHRVRHRRVVKVRDDVDLLPRDAEDALARRLGLAAEADGHRVLSLPSMTTYRDRVDLLMQMTRPVRHRVSTSQLAALGLGAAGLTLSSSSRVGVRVIDRIRL